MTPDSSELKNRARRLCRQQTDGESKLWARLRAGQLCRAKFRRQHPIGSFVVDFCCIACGLVIELDGGQHAERLKADRVRTAFIERRGYRVLCFWDNEVLQDMEAILEQIASALKDPHPFPLPNRARVKKNYVKAE